LGGWCSAPWWSKVFLGKKLDVVAVGDIVPADNLAYLLKYDSVQGRFNGYRHVEKIGPRQIAEDDVLVVNGSEIKVVSAKGSLRTSRGKSWASRS
jgi:glyceraldehyde-3-phosphate dehydrogenase/erythrose-4-phosphate dehydrogenase